MVTVSNIHHTYNPLLLSRKPIVVEDVWHGGEVLGLVHTNLAERPHNVYKIFLFQELGVYIYKQSPYYPTIKYPAFKLGILAHECSHVWWGTIDNPASLTIKNAIVKDIDNILSDTADEYRTMKKYRAYAKYIQLVLSCCKWDTPDAIKGTWIDQDLHTLFLLTRFGVVMPGSDENFVSFIFPLIVSSRRGNRKNTLDAVFAIYTYLQTKALQSDEMQKQWMQGLRSQQELRQVPLSDKEIEMILSSAQVDTSSVPFTMLQEAVKGQQQSDKSVLGQLAGTDGPPPDDEEQTDEFFRTTVGLYPKVVMRLSALWMQRMHKITKYMRFEDGRVPRKKKRIAYKDAH